MEGYFYLTALLRVLPGVKPGAFLDEIVIFSPVFGFLPILSTLFLILKVPNPVITTFSPLFKESRIDVTNDETASLDALFVRFAFLATTSIRSLFVKINHHPSLETLNELCEF